MLSLTNLVSFGKSGERIPNTIPIGGDEPEHEIGEGCWCFPTMIGGVRVHNAKDCREARERMGKNRVDEKWEIVLE